MTAIYFAWNHSTYGRLSLQEWDWENQPLHLLVSYEYLKQYRANPVPDGAPLSMMLDSGAFSAWKSGRSIDIDALIEECRRPEWDECVALDVIGDSEGSIRNSHYMREAGLNVIPVFHYGEPWEVLTEYCKFFGHVGLSCRFGEPMKKSLGWVEQCFARGWPHLFHSFGWVARPILERVPFDTADASTWTLAPSAYGRWPSMDNAHLPVRCTLDNNMRLFTEIDFYLRMQRDLEERWNKELHPIRLATLGESLTSRRTLWI